MISCAKSCSVKSLCVCAVHPACTWQGKCLVYRLLCLSPAGGNNESGIFFLIGSGNLIGPCRGPESVLSASPFCVVDGR